MSSTAVQPEEFTSVFSALKALLVPYAGSTTVSTDTETEYYLNSRYIQKNKKPLFFAAVQIKKNYVSFHLMPVYVEPTLLATMSDELKQRMQGKSCFNFTRTEPALFRELALLTKTGYEHYQQAGLLADNGFLTQLSAPAQRALAQAGVQVPEDLERFSEQDLLALHGVGPSAIPLLQSSLQAQGLSFKPN